MLSNIAWKHPTKWHIDFASNERNISERMVFIGFFAGLTALFAQISFIAPWSPVPYTLQTGAVMATGVYLRRNDAFYSGVLYLFLGALGAPVFAGQGDALFLDGQLIASGGYLLAFPIASALVAQGLELSRNRGHVEIKAQLFFWFSAMIPVYVFGTLWLAVSYSVSFTVAFGWGVTPFLIWDAAKIILLALVTTKVWAYSND